MERVELCAGAACRRRQNAGHGRRRTAGGGRLCAACAEGLLAELRDLPRLYVRCGQVLGGGRSQEPAERTSTAPRTGMPFNSAAAEARSAVLSTLSSWAALVADERGLRPPRRAIRDLAGYLSVHGTWLAGHPAAGELTEEISRLARQARRVIDPHRWRRVPVGACTEPGCGGSLTAHLRAEAAPGESSEIRCDAAPEHRWTGDAWATLGHRMLSRAAAAETAAGTAAGTASGTGDTGPVEAAGERGSEEPAPRVVWLSAPDIARLWHVPRGTVYRLASERDWRRRSAGGRTVYHGVDVTLALRDRGPERRTA